MRKLELNELKKISKADKYTGWITPWFEDPLYNCFSFLALELEPHEFFYSDGAACILISGSGTVDSNPIKENTSFGLKLIENKACMDSQLFKASSKSILLCFNKNIFDNICHGMGCGSLHTRIRNTVLSCL